MRSTILAALAGLACALPGCGGGGSGGGSLGSALALQGLVTSRDGTTQNLGGVTITCVESGEAVTTALNGRFALDVPKGVVLHLEVDDAAGEPRGGHRDVGGYRASMYNALPLESVQVLVEVMKQFEQKFG